jgi:ABC-type xylose transport system permease subunit
MKIILKTCMYLAGLGLVLNLILHISGFLGGIYLAYSSQADQVARYLNQGMFIVCVVSIIAANNICRDFKPKEFWTAALRGCPKALKYLPGLLIAYAFLFAVIHGSSGVPGSPSMVQLGCAFGMAIYAVSLVLLYSALHVQEVDEARKCPNGHQVPAAAMFCEECGAKVIESVSKPS